MNREKLAQVLTLIILVIIVVILWPLLKWLAIMIFALVLMAVIQMVISTKKINKQIKRSNQQFQQALKVNREAMDAEYREKVVPQQKENNYD